MNMTGLETRVLNLLAAGPLTASELRQNLDMEISYNALWSLLSGLRDAGFVVAEDARAHGYGGQGRKKYIYRLNEPSEVAHGHARG